jgi:hypothetical protein
MAHFAQIDENNVVLQVLVVPDEQQHRGYEYLAYDLMLGGRWIQTSYNGNIRKTYAGINYIYNEELDIFLPPKPYLSWVLDEVNGEWISPIPRPEGIPGKVLIWNEETQEWKQEDLPPILPNID